MGRLEGCSSVGQTTMKSRNRVRGPPPPPIPPPLVVPAALGFFLNLGGGSAGTRQKANRDTPGGGGIPRGGDTALSRRSPKNRGQTFSRKERGQKKYSRYTARRGRGGGVPHLPGRATGLKKTPEQHLGASAAWRKGATTGRGGGTPSSAVDALVGEGDGLGATAGARAGVRVWLVHELLRCVEGV